LGGGINTAFTYGIYFALNLTMNYQLAYLLAYALGVVFAYWFNAVLVFKVPLSWKGFFAYPLVYVLQYGSSALLLGVLVEFANMNEKFAPLLIAVCMLPFTYMLSRYVLSWSNKARFFSDRHVGS
jgi:putative flippase GtrA